MQSPTYDGQVIQYNAVGHFGPTPRIYYVNGIRVMPDDHARDASMLSVHAERPVFGVYNMSGKEQLRQLGASGRLAGLQEVGSIADLLQCGTDWVTAFGSQIGESGTSLVNQGLTGVRNAVGGAIDFVNQKTGWSLPTPTRDQPVNVANQLRRQLSDSQRLSLARKLLSVTNPAASSLFEQLTSHASGPQWIVAHSQGNLCTADALWAMAIALGDESMANVRVFSLASPTPAWPAGINHRRKVYGHTNDLVTLCDPHNWTAITKRVLNGSFGRSAGDWRQHGSSSTPGLEPHDFNLNATSLNFINRFRRDLGLSEYADKPSPPKLSN